MLAAITCEKHWERQGLRLIPATASMQIKRFPQGRWLNKPSAHPVIVPDTDQHHQHRSHQRGQAPVLEYKRRHGLIQQQHGKIEIQPASFHIPAPHQARQAYDGREGQVGSAYLSAAGRTEKNVDRGQRPDHTQYTDNRYQRRSVQVNRFYGGWANRGLRLISQPTGGPAP